MRKLILLPILAVIALLAGCGDQGTTPVIDNKSEMAAFPIPPEVWQQLQPYVLPEDGSLPAGEVVRSEVDPPAVTDTSYDVYTVTFLWGQLLNTHVTPAPPTDWSGTLSVNGVAIVATTHMIHFEQGQDSVLQDNLPASEGWVSTTNGDFDGLSFLVFLKRGIIYITPPVLTFDTPPFTLQLTFEQLLWFSAIYHVDNLNKVAVHARKIWPNACPHGLMTGEWVKDDVGGNTGHFGGLWLDENSEPAGVFSGVFWTENDGRRLFTGNVSGVVTNQIIAYLNGTWYYDDPRMCPLCGAGRGRFIGHFQNIIENRNGIIQGEFGDLTLPPDQLNLPLSGTWHYHCPFVNLHSSIWAN